jgi:autotransporter-associated beta strand protein
MRKITFIASVSACFNLFGASATWTGDSGSNWTTDANWDPEAYPDSGSDTATFDDSGQTGAVGVNAVVHVGTINFSASALNYTLSPVSGGTLNQTTQINGTNNSNSIISSDIGNIGSLLTISVESGSQIGISGKLTTTGSLTKAGSGILTLSGSSANAFTFGAHINGGILNIQKNGAIGFGPASVANGAQLQMQGGVTPTSAFMTLSGTGGGTGALLNISGNNTYSGSITIASDTTIGSSAGTMTLGAINGQVGHTFNLTSAGSGNITINGVIGSRVVQLSKNGSGTLTLGGNNTFTGGTFINLGTLSIGSVNNIGGSSASVTLAGGTLSATGNVTTSGSIEVTNSSTITTAVSHTTTLNGTLTGSDGAILSLMGDGTNVLSTIAVGGSDSFTVAGAFGGSSAMTKTGTGTLVITGNNTSFTGPMSVAAGQLKVNGSLQNTSLLTLSPNTTLSGTGSIGPITCFGTLSPGNSVGTLSSGSVVLENSSLFFVELDPTGASLLDVTGSAALNGTLEVVQDAGLYARSGQYPILQTTDGLSGSFSSILLSPLSGFTLSVLERGNDLILAYNSGLLTEGLSGNALKIGNYLNQYGTAAAINPLLNLDENALKNALERISPSRNADSGYISNLNAFSINRLASSHIDYLRILDKMSSQNQATLAFLADAAESMVIPLNIERPNHFSTWVSSFVDFSYQGGSNQNPSFNFISEAALVGFDYRVPLGGLVGSTLGYLHTYFYDDERMGHGNTNSGFFSFYGDVLINCFYIKPALLGVFNVTNNTRNIAFSNFSANAHANIYSWQLVPHLEIGYDFDHDFFDIQPFSSVDYAVNWQRGYKETNAAPYNAIQSGKTTSMIRSETGLKFFQTWMFNWGSIFLKEKASYIFEKPFGNTVTAFLAGTPNTFTVTALTHNLNLGSIELDFFSNIGTKSPIGISLGYDGEFGSNYISNEVTVTLNKSF